MNDPGKNIRDELSRKSFGMNDPGKYIRDERLRLAGSALEDPVADRSSWIYLPRSRVVYGAFFAGHRLVMPIQIAMGIESKPLLSQNSLPGRANDIGTTKKYETICELGASRHLMRMLRTATGFPSYALPSPQPAPQTELD
jgi:hypothetical protein